MTQLDTSEDRKPHTSLLATPDSFNFEIDHALSDHDMLLQHVVQEDHSLYALDCCLGEMASV